MPEGDTIFRTARTIGMARFVEEAGFIATSFGFQMRRLHSAPVPEIEDDTGESD